MTGRLYDTTPRAKNGRQEAGSLRRELLVRIGLLLALSVFSMGSLMGFVVYRFEAATWKERQREAANSAASQVEGFLAQQQTVLDALASLGTDELRDQGGAVTKIFAENSSLLEVISLDREGKVMGSIARGDPVLLDLFTIPQSSWFQSAADGDVYYSVLQISPRGEPYMILSIPLANGGVAAARLELRALWQMVSGLRFGNSGHVFILDHRGVLVAHPDYRRVIASDNLDNHPQLAAFIGSPNQFSDEITSLDGGSVMAVKALVTRVNWVVVAALPTEEYFAGTRQIGTYLGLTLLAGFVIFFVLMNSTLNSIVLAPLRRLRKGAHKIGAGELSLRIPVGRRDELGDVTEAFNWMAGALAEREHEVLEKNAEVARQAAEKEGALSELERSYQALERRSLQLAEILEIGNSLRVTLAQDEMLQTLVEGLARSLDFHLTVLANVDPQTDRMFIAAQTGISSGMKKRINSALLDKSYLEFYQMLSGCPRYENCYFIPGGKFNWLSLTLMDNYSPGAENFDIEAWFKDWGRGHLIVVVMEKQPGQVLGMMLLTEHDREKQVGVEMLQSLEVYANLVAGAIENAQLFNQLQDELAARAKAEKELGRLNEELENRVSMRTQQLTTANVELRREVDERIRTERALLESEERYDLALRGANDGLWDWDLRTDQIYLSERWKSMLGYVGDELPGRSEAWFSLIHPEDVEGVKIALGNHLRGLTALFQSEHRVLHKDGSYRWALVRGLAIPSNMDAAQMEKNLDYAGLPFRMAGSQTDITVRKETEAQLLHDAFHDGLTGLPNRALFLDRLGHAIVRANRHALNSYGVLFLDLDRFKVINDSLGHAVGDELLVALSSRLGSCLRSEDTAARLGGDEFVILLEDISDASMVTQVAERIRTDWKTPIVIGTQTLHVTVSIGVVLGNIGYELAEDVLRDADIALYRAKALGKDRIAIFDTSQRSRAMTRLTLEGDLRNAIERREFVLYYQPIFALKTAAVSGFEALLRWESPEHGWVMPSDFIPLAEETGLIVPLGDWALHEACRQAMIWQRAYPQDPPLTMNVNISGVQISDAQFLPLLQSVLEESSLPPASLRLEITESVFIENADQAIDLMRRICALGVQLQIDDFGTGYSSMAYLQRFPISSIKIDRSFISMMGSTDEQGASNSDLVRTIVTMARELGIQAIAEGVETQAQLETLKRLKCPYLQGFLMSKPVPAETAGTMLQLGASLPVGEDG